LDRFYTTFSTLIRYSDRAQSRRPGRTFPIPEPKTGNEPFECLLRQKQNESLNDCRKNRWHHHNRLERGNPVRVYEGEAFRLKNISVG